MRPWMLWLSLLLLAASIGWFWFLSSGIVFQKTDQTEPRSAVEQKTEGRKEK